MKGNSRIKILAFAMVAALVAGVAIAAVSAGLITSSPSNVATNLGTTYLTSSLPDGVANPLVSNDAKLGYSVPQDAKIEGDLTLTTLGQIGNTAPDQSYRGTGLNGIILTLPWDFAWVPGTEAERDGAAPIASKDFGGALSDRGANIAGAITVGKGVTFTIEPGLDGNTRRLVGVRTANVNAMSADGVLRLMGSEGVTEVFAPNNNAPTSQTNWNNYSGGTALIEGRLNVKHSNALGYGPIVAYADTVLGFDYNDEISFGGTPFQGGPSLGLVDGVIRQPLSVYRVNRIGGTNLGWDAVRTTTTRRGAPVEFNVTRATDSQLTTFTAHTGIMEVNQYSNRGSATNTVSVPILSGDSAPYGIRQQIGGNVISLDAVQLLKTGEGKMVVSNMGTRHRGGTWVRGGTLELLNEGESGNRYVGELGATWRHDGGFPNEQQNPQVNYNNMLAHVNNSLRIDEGALVRLNRDQFFGNFDGEGTFEALQWASTAQNRIPQITVLMDRFGTNAADSWQRTSTFSGLMTGQFNFVLRGGIAKTAAYLINGDQTKLTLSGEDNTITVGDTTIVDGTLSINSIGQLPPGDIRLGLAAGDTTRGIARTDAVPTFHGWGNFVVDRKVTTAINTAGFAITAGGVSRVDDVGSTRLGPVEVNANTRDARFRRLIPNLAADYGYTVSFNDVVLTRTNADILDNGVGYQSAVHFTVNNQLGSASIPYAGWQEIGGALAQTYLGGISLATPVANERGWNGTIAFNNYVLPGETTASTPFVAAVMNGIWQLNNTPAEGKGFMDVFVSPGATLSLGENARDFENNMDVRVANDSRIRVVVKPSDLYASREAAMANPAIFEAALIDYSFNGSKRNQVAGTTDVGFQMGTDYADQRLGIQLDLSQVEKQLKAGQWIKVVSSRNAIDWNNMHYLRSSSSTKDEDYPKIRLMYANATDIDGNKVEAVLDENTYTIFVKVKESVDPVEDTNWTFSNTVATNAAIGGTVNLHELNGTAVPNQDATIYLFHAGTDYADNANALANVPVTTDANGNAIYAFSAGNYGFNTRYVIKAVAAGYTDATVAVTTNQGGGGGSSSSCSAGFAPFALLLLAPLALRRKD